MRYTILLRCLLVGGVLFELVLLTFAWRALRKKNSVSRSWIKLITYTFYALFLTVLFAWITTLRPAYTHGSLLYFALWLTPVCAAVVFVQVLFIRLWRRMSRGRGAINV